MKRLCLICLGGGIAEGHKLLEHINSQREDVIFFSKVPPIKGIYRAGNNDGYDKLGESTRQKWNDRLVSLFKNHLESKPVISKMHYIDTNGKELVVVGRELGKLVVASQKELRNKSHRPYVRETLKLEYW